MDPHSRLAIVPVLCMFRIDAWQATLEGDQVDIGYDGAKMIYVTSSTQIAREFELAMRAEIAQRFCGRARISGPKARLLYYRPYHGREHF